MAHKGYHAEHEIARRLKAKRIGGPGNMDIDGGWFSAEVKQRTLPIWMRDAWNAAWDHMREGQLPLVILHAKGERYQDAIICIRLDDFVDWFGDARRLRTPCELTGEPSTS